MVTTYSLLCSCGCGKLIERRVYASGACRVRAKRDTSTVTNSYKDTKDVTLSYKVTKPVIKVSSVIKTKEDAIRAVKAPRGTTGTCRHGLTYHAGCNA